MDPRLEPDQLRAPLEQQVLAEPVAPVHLEREPAEIAETLLANAQERTPLTPQRARRRHAVPSLRGGVAAAGLSAASGAAATGV